MAAIRRVPISKEKLLNELSKRGMSMTEASRQMGAEGMYLTNCCARGGISLPYMIALEHTCNIKYDDIKPDEPVAEPEPETNAQMTMDIPDDMQRLIDALRPVIYAEARRAFHDGMNE